MKVDQLDVALYQLASPSGVDPAKSDEGAVILAARSELDGYYVQMRAFDAMDVTDIFQKVAAWSGRAAELRSHLVRQESRRAATFRTRELEPFLEQLDFQFRVYSRLQSVRQMEADLARGT